MSLSSSPLDPTPGPEADGQSPPSPGRAAPTPALDPDHTSRSTAIVHVPRAATYHPVSDRARPAGRRPLRARARIAGTALDRPRWWEPASLWRRPRRTVVVALAALVAVQVGIHLWTRWNTPQVRASFAPPAASRISTERIELATGAGPVVAAADPISPPSGQSPSATANAGTADSTATAVAVHATRDSTPFDVTLYPGDEVEPGGMEAAGAPLGGAAEPVPLLNERVQHLPGVEITVAATTPAAGRAPAAPNPVARTSAPPATRRETGKAAPSARAPAATRVAARPPAATGRRGGASGSHVPAPGVSDVRSTTVAAGDPPPIAEDSVGTTASRTPATAGAAPATRRTLAREARRGVSSSGTVPGEIDERRAASVGVRDVPSIGVPVGGPVTSPVRATRGGGRAFVSFPGADAAWSRTVQSAVVALARGRSDHDAGRYRDAVETLERARRSVQDAALPQHLAFERWRLDRELREASDRSRDACDAARTVARDNGYLAPRCPR